VERRQSGTQLKGASGPMLGLYLHIPFCSAICNYCNFNRGLFDAGLKDRYVDALVAEVLSAATPAAPEAVDTVYFGGGTPSLLSAGDVARIVSACRAAFGVTPDAEVTLEANPETVDVDLLRAFRTAGVNRLSFGVQSLRDDELKRLSRLHGAARARAAVAEARAAGFGNVSIDLMMWLPEQTPEQWLESVDAAVVLSPDHLSLYMLEVYPNAPLRDEMARARWTQAPDEDAEAMYLTAMDRLETAGLAQYEISNVARPGMESRHNTKYWEDGEWLGFGCGAHSTRNGVRWKNVSSTADYIGRIAAGEPVKSEIRTLSADERLGDALFTGLRLSKGVDIDAVGRRYGADVWQRYGAELQHFVDEGILRRQGPTLSLSRRGMLLANEVMAVFV
jgi:oxygen-independent coproporphyrinogen-3 oxidase